MRPHSAARARGETWGEYPAIAEEFTSQRGQHRSANDLASRLLTAAKGMGINVALAWIVIHLRPSAVAHRTRC